MIREKSIAYFATPSSIHDCKWINHFAKKNKVIVFCSSRILPPYTLLDSNIDVFSILPPYSIFNVIFRMTTTRRLKKIIKEQHIEIIHSIYAVPNAIWADAIAKNDHIITTIGSDLLIDYEKRYSSSRNLFRRFSYSVMKKKIRKSFLNSKIITSTCKKQLDVVERMIGKTSKTKLVRTGVDSSLFKNEPNEKKENEIRVFSTRSMKPLYNIDLIVYAFAKAVKSDGRLKLILIDDKSDITYSKSIVQLVEKLEVVDKVEFLPSMSQVEMVKQYQRADLTIMIPKSDGTPNCAIEAMLVGIPVILGPLNYDEDLFNESTVWKSKSFDPVDISKLILLVLAEKSNSLKENFAKEAALRHADLDMSLKSIEKAYKNVVHES